MHPRLWSLIALVLLAGCTASEPPPRRQSYGPPSVGMTPAQGMGSFQGSQGWNSAAPSFQPTPSGSFKGF